MPNDTNNRILIEHLKNDRTTELMPHDLNEMLDQELSKSAEDIDTQLVKDLLDLLEEEVPTQKSKDECWKAIQAHTQKKDSGRRNAVLRRISAVAAALVMVIVVSFGTAKAFNWTFLLKLLGPAMETFGIYSTNSPNNHADDNDGHEYVDEDLEFAQVNYTAMEDMPTQLRGYTIVPRWIPERYTFATGSIYEDKDIATASMCFQYDEEFLILNISFYANDEDATAFTYEAYTESEHSMQVENQSVKYYHNDSGEIRAVSAIAQNVHVYIGGRLSEHELEQIIASMN